jgi:hypothetical protein
MQEMGDFGKIIELISHLDGAESDPLRAAGYRRASELLKSNGMRVHLIANSLIANRKIEGAELLKLLG